jgi:large subunit ribosomal protein L10
MSKAIKALITDDLKTRYAGATSACVVEITGLDVQAQEKMRRDLRAKSGRLEVVKNSLAKYAFKGGPLEALGDALTGPCALVTAKESMIEVAKYLVEATKDFKSLKLKVAVYEGDRALITVEALSRMRGKRELLGELAMLLASPGRALAGCLRSPQAKIAGCLKTLADKAA